MGREESGVEGVREEEEEVLAFTDMLMYNVQSHVLSYQVSIG